MPPILPALSQGKATPILAPFIALWAVPSQAGGWCWKIKEPSGGEEDGCAPPNRKLGKTIQLDITPGPQAGSKAILLAHVGADIRRVEIHYRSGATDQVRPIDGFVFYAPSRSRTLGPRRHQRNRRLQRRRAAGRPHDNDREPVIGVARHERTPSCTERNDRL